LRNIGCWNEHCRGCEQQIDHGPQGARPRTIVGSRVTKGHLSFEGYQTRGKAWRTLRLDDQPPCTMGPALAKVV
jgi:hypothetical protein